MPFVKRRYNTIWRIFVILTAPAWAPIVGALCILAIILGVVLGFFEGCYRFVTEGEFKSEIID
jgi:hypothetical protein